MARLSFCNVSASEVSSNTLSSASQPQLCGGASQLSCQASNVPFPAEVPPPVGGLNPELQICNLQGGSCVANVCSPNSQQSCPVANGTGLKTCNNLGTGFGACGGAVSCNSGFNLQNGTCTAACIPSGDQSAINAALGAGRNAILCQNSVFNISGAVQFSSPNQELSTEGLPTGDSRAIINVSSSNLVTAIFASNLSNIRIKNIIVNGNRPQLGFQPNPTTALIEMGGSSSGQVIDHVKAFEPRGWSTVHISEGSLNCTNATISNNDIGPAGEPNNTWADGISMGCANSSVVNNTVTDATDGGIVIFQAPGTTVSSNTVISSNRVLLGGINLVDYAQYQGNYSGTVVTNNVIRASGSGFIKIGIAMGAAAWGISGGSNYNGTVNNNTFIGSNFGYGIVGNGITGFNVNGNNFDGAGFLGFLNGCPADNAPPQAIVIDASSNGNFQGHTTAPVNRGICIQPQFAYSPGGFALATNQQLTLGDLMYVVLQSDGNFVIYGAPGQALWASGTSRDCSANQCQAQFQGDGNFVLSQNGQAYWATNTDNRGVLQVRFSPTSPYMQIVNGGGVSWQSN